MLKIRRRDSCCLKLDPEYIVIQMLNHQQIAISDRDFFRFRDLIYDECGINLAPAKKIMLSLRLRKRLRVLDMVSFGQYYDYLSSTEGRSEELVHMLDVVSTNKTDFFREARHFEYLEKVALPGLVQCGYWNPGRRLNVWSAGCSSGEEPYTIAMVLADAATGRSAGDFSVFASDISTRMLEIARKGIYPESAIEPVPPVFKYKYLMRGKGSKKGFLRVVPELRDRLQFQRINLNNGMDFGIRSRMDMIFCRNVIIYFDRETQKKLFEKFYAQLVPGGYLFIGHSESLHGINDRFKPVATATYQKPG